MFVFISLRIHFSILQCIYMVSTCSLKKYTRWYQIVATPTTLFGECFRFYYMLSFICVRKIMLIFFMTVYFAFFTELLLSTMHKQLPSCLQFSDRSKLPFRLVFNHGMPQLLKFKPSSSLYTHDYSNTLLFSSWIWKNSKFCCRSKVNGCFCNWSIPTCHNLGI